MLEDAIKEQNEPKHYIDLFDQSPFDVPLNLVFGLLNFLVVERGCPSPNLHFLLLALIIYSIQVQSCQQYGPVAQMARLPASAIKHPQVSSRYWLKTPEGRPFDPPALQR